jgi:5-methylcytosine-specific restriction endonuclease McrA
MWTGDRHHCPSHRHSSVLQNAGPTCESCSQTYFEGGGRKIAVNDADAARAECDAQRIGPDQRATQDIAPKTRRDVLHRDGGKCTVPRCRSARFIEVHHIVPRSEGGSHDASNLTSLCDGHHVALHEHKLVISGSAPNISVRFMSESVVPQMETATHVAARHAAVNRTSAIPHVETLAAPRVSSEHAPNVEPPTIPHVETPPATCVRQAELKSTPNANPPAIPHGDSSDELHRDDCSARAERLLGCGDEGRRETSLAATRLQTARLA